MSLFGYVFVVIYGWMMVQFCMQPDEPEPAPKITAPALHDLDMTQASGASRHLFE